MNELEEALLAAAQRQRALREELVSRTAANEQLREAARQFLAAAEDAATFSARVVGSLMVEVARSAALRALDEASARGVGR